MKTGSLSFCLGLLFSFSVALSSAAPSGTNPQDSTLTKRDAPPPVSTVCGGIVNSGNVVFPAKQVYDCLTSVPFDAAVATRFISYYNDTIRFQSTLSYLKNPPASYQQRPVDLVAGLNEIQRDISNGNFANQYEFEATLQRLIYATHDAHLNLYAGIFGVFTFGSTYQIASVSPDGIRLPKVYFSDDLNQSQFDGNWQPSAISKINGFNVQDFLDEFAAANSQGTLEPHADFNQLMISPAQDIQGIFGIWNGGAGFYPGDELTFTLENGTVIKDSWKAVYNYQQPTGPLETGGDFYNFFVLGFYPASYAPDTANNPTNTGSATPSSTTTTAATTSTAPPSWSNQAYPSVPDVAQDDLGLLGTGVVSGYFLRQSSVAVLSLPSFQEPGSAFGSYSAAVARFLSAAKSAGMQRVVIDVQQNYGGDVFLAIDTFKQFFPARQPFGGSRMRATEPVDAMGGSITDYWAALDDTYDDYYNFYDDEFMPLTRLNSNTGRSFQSWDENFGPHNFNGDNFTTVQRYNLSDTLFSTIATDDETDTYGFTVYGEGIRPANTTKPYEANDIIILSDSLCSSACAVFMELMVHEAGVRTVVAGGRPFYGPMQTPSMSRGAAAYGVDDLDYRIDAAQQLLQNSSNPNAANFLPNRTAANDVFITYADVNLRDQVRKDSDMPLQFVYEAATCRIFFTPQTYYNFTALWTYAANAIWSDSSLCVQNSTGYSSPSATNVTAPPSSILPSLGASSPEPSLGAIIMSLLEGESSLSTVPIMDQGQPTRQSQTSLYGLPCGATGICPSEAYYCAYTSLKCDLNKQLILDYYCVPYCNPNEGSFTSQTCKNTGGDCQPLYFSDNDDIVHVTGYCNPRRPDCRVTNKKPSSFNTQSPENE